jgi:serine acetyltransferase
VLDSFRQDLGRLREEDPSLRGLVRGVTSPAFWAIVVYRVFNWCHRKRLPVMPIRVLAERLVEIVSGVELPSEAAIGPGLRILHGRGIVVHPRTVIGARCTLFHEVTLGGRLPGDGGPTIGANVVLGAGSKVLGRIVLADGCRVGANSVVLSSAPSGATLVGVPARTIVRSTAGEDTKPLSRAGKTAA